MRSLLYTVIAIFFIQSVLCDLMSDMKDEFELAESVLEAKEAEKELLSLPLNDEDNAAVKDDKKDASVEAQLQDLLNSVNKDKKAVEEKKDENKALFDMLQKFEKADSIDKDSVLEKMEDVIKKEVLSSDVAKDSPGRKCGDVRRDCLKLARSGYCKSHEDEMRKKCAKTCQYCADCVNQLKDETCKRYNKYKYCAKHKLRMKKYCFKECGYCSRSYIERRKCATSKYGCCWDKITPKSDKAGTECPDCKDRNKKLCKRFHFFCARRVEAGEFMRRFCPSTCGICGLTCSDDFKLREKCSTWKQLGWCKTLKASMKVLCQKTCELC